MKPQAHKEHHWLQRFVGEWTYEGEASMGPGQPAEKYSGTESVRSLEGIWTLCEGRDESGTSSSVMTLGYDPARGRFVGTYVTGMMTHLWLYDGELDAASNRLVLDSEGPSLTNEGQTGKYRDTIELVSDDHRVLTSQFLFDDGEWREFMRADYRRVK
ncbi:MAG TPA: DUF1579 domain-containing protein [Longimicrobium sp.]|nr:DUF1579 domain-containing protein [Longimicrobium sp.]